MAVKVDSTARYGTTQYPTDELSRLVLVLDSFSFRLPMCVLSAALLLCLFCLFQLELQSASRRSSLLDTASSTSGSSPTSFSTFPSDGHSSYVVSELLIESGLHCLVCSISYRENNQPASASAAPVTYQKYFKFNVLSALSIASVVHSRDDWLLAELAVTNSTTRPLLITRVHIDTRSDDETTAEPVTEEGEGQSDSAWSSSSSHFLVRRIGSAPRESDSPLSPQVDALLAPSATRMYLFRLDPLTVDSRRVVDIGRVSVEWRQHMGELCLLTAACPVHRTAKTNSAQMAAAATQPAGNSSTLPAAASVSTAFPALPPPPPAARPSDVSLQLVSCPATAVLEQPFPVRVLLSNPLPFALLRCQLLLMRDKMGSVLPVGRSRMYVGTGSGAGESAAVVGTMQPRSSHTVDLTLAGIGLGVHKIGGMRVIAHSTAAPTIQLDFDSLQQIEIVAHE